MATVAVAHTAYLLPPFVRERVGRANLMALFSFPNPSRLAGSAESGKHRLC